QGGCQGNALPQERVDGDPGPAAANELALRGEDRDPAGLDFVPGGEPAVRVVEIELSPAVEHAVEIGQPQRVPQPGSTVQKGNAPHPVRVLVQDQQVERPWSTLHE